MASMFTGGLVYGFIDKKFPDLPRMPIIGKSGTVALAAYLFGGKYQIVRDTGIAAAAIAGYTLGKTGVVSGVGDEFDDEHGLAAEA